MSNAYFTLLTSLAVEPLEPDEGRVRKLERQELISYSTRWLSSSGNTKVSTVYEQESVVGGGGRLTFVKLEGHIREEKKRKSSTATGRYR